MNTPVTNEQIDIMLDNRRPDRYDVDDRQWRDPVVTYVAQHMPVKQAQQIAAERLVSEREGKATRSVNRMLRKVAQEQQWPIPDITTDLNRRPLSIGSERVCLQAATPLDFQQWAIDERRDGAQEFAARSGACDGAEWIAQHMNHKGWHTFGEGHR